MGGARSSRMPLSAPLFKVSRRQHLRRPRARAGGTRRPVRNPGKCTRYDGRMMNIYIEREKERERERETGVYM